MKKIIIFEKINYTLYFKHLLSNLFSNKKKKIEIFYIYPSLKLKILRIFFPFLIDNIKNFNPIFSDIKSDNVCHPYIDFQSNDFHNFFNDFYSELESSFFKEKINYDYFKIFFKKKMFFIFYLKYIKNMFLINAASAKFNVRDKKVTLYLLKMPWEKQLKKYSANININLKYYDNIFTIITNIYLFLRITPLFNFLLFFKIIKFKLINIFKPINKKLSDLKKPSIPIMIESTFDFIFNYKFWNEKIINPKNAIFASRNPIKGLESIIRKKNLLTLNSIILPSEDNYNFINRFNFNLKFINKSLKLHYLNSINAYDNEKIFWKKSFKQFNSKIFITSHLWEPHSLCACDAINDLQGTSIYIQQSYYDIPSGGANLKADIFFSFSNKITNNINQFTGSKISYNISSGYIKDYIFNLVKEKSIIIRNKLKKNGSKKIIALFDQTYEEENFLPYNKETYINNYIFWLQKIIDEPWLGIIFKPKQPGKMFSHANNPYKLVKGFEEMQPLLNQVLSTGRCFFYLNRGEYSDKNYNDTVAEAAMAADLSVHDMLSAGTAGIESALTGTPTLLYDDLDVKESQLYKLGKNKVVFDNWDTMWEKIQCYFNNQSTIGDWSKILDDIDPFRDGKASYRINQFIYWLLEKYKLESNKDNAIAYAVKKYSDTWGEDKIIKNN